MAPSEEECPTLLPLPLETFAETPFRGRSGSLSPCGRGPGAEGSAARLRGEMEPHAPSRRSVRCAPLWPTHPPSDLLHVGAEPPRPRRVSARGVAFAGATCFRGRSAPSPRGREGVSLLCGGCAPRPIPGRACAARGSGPPTRPRIFFMWGRSPHAPAGSAHAAWPSRAQRAFEGVRLPRPEGERAFPPLWGLRPTPHPGRACAARGSGPPTRPRIFFMWGRSPHAPAGSAHAAWPSRAQRAFEGVRLPRPEGERAFPPLWGLRPTPHPGRACAARGSGPPTRPRIFFMWGRSPHAPAGSAHAAWPSRAQRAFEGVPAPSPRGLGWG